MALDSWFLRLSSAARALLGSKKQDGATELGLRPFHQNPEGGMGGGGVVQGLGKPQPTDPPTHPPTHVRKKK